MTNFDLSLQVFSFLKLAQVDTVIVCAGARNAPMALALQNENFKQNFKIYSFFEERSAAFFALGLIKATQKPVAVLTTSGTAAAELLPATIESYYQGLPLILITADRPKNYRGTGSPQTIEQVGLFSNYVEAVYDFDIASLNFNFIWSQKKPIHLNVAFDEPLIDTKSELCLGGSLKKPTKLVPLKNSDKIFDRPLLILGEIASENRQQVVDFILKTKAPVYAEPLSQLKTSPQIQNYLVKSSDLIIKQIFKLNLCNGVIRIGGVPTLRFWRDLEHEFKHIPVISYTNLPFSGLSRESIVIEINQLEPLIEFSADNLQKIKATDNKIQKEKTILLNKYPLCEQNLTKLLSDIVSTEALYLGNSLPIRNWDQFAECKSKIINANRGANGIDGQVASYLGWSENIKKSFCYIGDLTAMYDLAALGLSPQLQPNQRNIVVVNNFGGQIFNRVFNDNNNNFINAHRTQFYHWAQMWNWNYLQISQTEELKKISALEAAYNIIEFLPNAEQTQLFWNEWNQLCPPH